MYTVIGTLLFAVAVTLFFWSALQYRQPVPAHWTKSTFSAMLLALTSTVSFLLSLAFAGQGYFTSMPGEFLTLPVIALSAAILCVGAYATYRMSLQWRGLNQNQLAFAVDFSGPAEVAGLAAANDTNAGGPNPRRGMPSGSKPRRPRAA